MAALARKGLSPVIVISQPDGTKHNGTFPNYDKIQVVVTKKKKRKRIFNDKKQKIPRQFPNGSFPDGNFPDWAFPQLESSPPYHPLDQTFPH